MTLFPETQWFYNEYYLGTVLKITAYFFHFLTTSSPLHPLCGGCNFYRIIQFLRCLFFKNKMIFCRLKLEIALAIPALNEYKIIPNNSAA